jgi:HEPN domain-containing protein
MPGKRRAEARRWFRQSGYDLEAARWNIQGGFHDTACFLAQQAGEKALKSLLYYLGRRRTALMSHSLVEMVEQGSKGLSTLETLREDARTLDLHYIPSRYPNGLPSGYPHQFYVREMADQAVRAADHILNVVTEHYERERESEFLEGDEGEPQTDRTRGTE